MPGRRHSAGCDGGQPPEPVGYAPLSGLPCRLASLQSGGPQAAIDWLKKIPDFTRDTAADLGTQVHAMAEALGRGELVPVDQTLRPYLAAYRRDFLDVFHPRFLAVEAMVCSERYEYGGTADAFVEIEGALWLLDYKTGAGVYPDAALQLAGLARAQFIGRPGDPCQYPLPAATRFGILQVRPEGARLYPVTVDRQTVAAFLDARRLFEWDQGPAKQVIGEPLRVSASRAAA